MDSYFCLPCIYQLCLWNDSILMEGTALNSSEAKLTEGGIVFLIHLQLPLAQSNTFPVVVMVNGRDSSTNSICSIPKCNYMYLFEWVWGRLHKKGWWVFCINLFPSITLPLFLVKSERPALQWILHCANNIATICSHLQPFTTKKSNTAIGSVYPLSEVTKTFLKSMFPFV